MNRIKELRLSNGMKQSELAALLSVSPTAISKYELGQLDISSSTINRLCDIFGCTADYLLGRSDRPEPELTLEEEQLLSAWASAPAEIRAIIDTALAPYQKDASASASTA